MTRNKRKKAAYEGGLFYSSQINVRADDGPVL